MKIANKIKLLVIPLVLIPFIIILFGCFVFGRIYLKTTYGIGGNRTVESYANPLINVNNITEALIEDIYKDPDQLMNQEYLEELNQKLAGSNSFLVVRIGDEISYQGIDDISGIVSLLPKYGDNKQIEGGLFIDADKPIYLRQKDVTLSNDQTGTLFIITYLDSLETGMRKVIIQLMIMITAVLLMVSGFTSLYIYWIFVRPLRLLQEGTERIKEGNLEEDVEILSDDEIGEVCQSFNEMRQKLKESVDDRMRYEKENRELISNISHDLKTPITAIKGYVEGIMDGVADTPEKMSRYIRTIYNKANEMDALINELSLYTKIDNNAIPYNFVKIKVSSYFDDCIEDVSVDMEAAGVTFEYENSCTPDTRVVADPEQIRRVIGNIVTNAVKYNSKEERKIRIEVKPYEDHYIYIGIRDNGNGISKEDLPMIFKRMYRTDASRNSSTGGSGLGLAIAKRIIEEHGGKIWAESEEGKGTLIAFTLKKYEESADKEEL